MDISKHYEFFQAPDIKEPIHIIGVGAVGSTIAEMLTRLGVQRLHLYDFDHVSPHNIANQMYNHFHINENKTDAISKYLKAINPGIDVRKHKKYTNQILSGYIFMCADQMDVRKQIVNNHKYYKTQVKAMFDFRMGLELAQHYATPFDTDKDVEMFLKQMDFTNEEAEQNAPKNACGMDLAIISTVRAICSIGISNFINYEKGRELKRLIQFDAFNFMLDVI